MLAVLDDGLEIALLLDQRDPLVDHLVVFADRYLELRRLGPREDAESRAGGRDRADPFEEALGGVGLTSPSRTPLPRGPADEGLCPYPGYGGGRRESRSSGDGGRTRVAWPPRKLHPAGNV